MAGKSKTNGTKPATVAKGARADWAALCGDAGSGKEISLSPTTSRSNNPLIGIFYAGKPFLVRTKKDGTEVTKQYGARGCLNRFDDSDGEGRNRAIAWLADNLPNSKGETSHAIIARLREAATEKHSGDMSDKADRASAAAERRAATRKAKEAAAPQKEAKATKPAAEKTTRAKKTPESTVTAGAKAEPRKATGRRASVAAGAGVSALA